MRDCRFGFEEPLFQVQILQVIDYEREKKEIETAIAKKEKEVSGQQSSLEDEQNQVRVAIKVVHGGTL